MFEALAAFFITYLLHATLLLGLVAGLDRAGWLARWGVAEPLWRAALLGAWLTAFAAQWAAADQPLAQAAQAEQINTVRAAAPMIAAPSTAAPSIAVPLSAAAATKPALAPTDSATLPIPWRRVAGATALLAAALWALGAFIGLARLGWQTARLQRITQRLPVWKDDLLQAQAQRWAQQHGRPVPVLRHSPMASPWAWALGWGRGTVGLPAWVATDLTAQQRQAVLAHELAHLARRDPLWRGACLLAATLGWPHPLNFLALRRLDALMELACDQAAAPDAATRHALAQSLVRCAERVRGATATPGLLPAMAAPDAQALLARMRRLLEFNAMSHPSIRHLRWWLAGGLLVAAVALPAAMLPRDASLTDLLPDGVRDWADELAQGLDLNDVGAGFGATTVVRTGGPGLRQSMRWKGKVRFNDAEDDVLAVDGPLRFREERGDTVREWLVTPSPQGLQRSYSVNGTVQAEPDAQGRAWIQEMVRIAAQATLPVGVRARRHWEHGGLEGLMRFVNGGHEDYQRRMHIDAALGAMPAAQRPAELLDRLLVASSTIGRAFERRHALQAIAAQGPSTEQQWFSLLQQVQGMYSDF